MKGPRGPFFISRLFEECYSEITDSLRVACASVKWTAFLYLFLFLCAFNSQGATYTVIAYNPPNPPYSFPGPERKGVFKDIFTHIGQITGDQFELIPVPVARGLNEFDRGRIDIEPGVNPKWRQHVK